MEMAKAIVDFAITTLKKAEQIPHQYTCSPFALKDNLITCGQA